ncbi:hypothetical protein GCM10010182_38380 [Actinomadura cremea]|nr:hypothetical protein GCM10010182_38380 [Actinomadura cremea]
MDGRAVAVGSPARLLDDRPAEAARLEDAGRIAVLVVDGVPAGCSASPTGRAPASAPPPHPVIAGTFMAVLVIRDLAATLALPPGVAGHEGSTVLVGPNGLRLLTDRAWRRAAVTATRTG